MKPKTVIAIVAALLIVGVGGVLFYLNRPVAEEASIDNALTALEESDGSADATAPPTPTSTPVDPDASEASLAPASGTAGTGSAVPLVDATGSWTVDTAIGDFDFADATSTFVGFRVNEELRNVGETEAVGRTPAVSGTLTIDGTMLQTATIEADFTQISSDIPNRDRAMIRALGVETFPTGTFELTSPVDFGEIPTEGESITFTATGDLMVNGMSNPTNIELEAQVADGNILVVGRAPVVFADYAITAPQAGPVVAIADNGTIEMQIWFTRP